MQIALGVNAHQHPSTRMHVRRICGGLTGGGGGGGGGGGSGVSGAWSGVCIWWWHVWSTVDRMRLAHSLWIDAVY